MRLFIRLLTGLTFAFGLAACIDPEAILLRGTVDIVVVDGTITDLAEPQFIRLNRSRADPYGGQFGTLPLTNAQVVVIVMGSDSTSVVARETGPGQYQLPSGFRGKAGNTYRLRFQLPGGVTYESTGETLPAVPPIDRVTDQYNTTDLSFNRPAGLLAVNDLYVQTTDPANQTNFYRWDWTLWEQQNWCQTCTNGFYYQYDDAGRQIDQCVPYPVDLFQGNGPNQSTRYYDYECRTQCWDIFFSNQLNLFADTYTNGRVISGRRVGQIPFYQYRPALVELRQSALTPAAYAYYNLLNEQTQRTGGLTDAPPAAPIGNVRSLTNRQEAVVGYFTASGVSSVRYWLTRRNVTGGLPFAPGTELSNVFFKIFNQRDPVTDPFVGVRGRPPLAVCVPGPTRTPVKPEGWQD
ncbi:MAG: DUF4249 domain-containing protein [Spirosoma sp.]|nr:DUF4249 domain-containing protein [Spirosoma sp.]